MRSVPREGQWRMAADVREGQLKLMEECLAATIPTFVHTALLSGLPNIT